MLPGRLSRAVLLALAAVGLAALAAACGTGSGSPQAAAEQGDARAVADTGVAAGSSGGPIALDGSGSTFQAPLVVKWSGLYHEASSGVQVNYQPIGSGGGIEQFTAGITDFGGTDAPMSAEELAAARQKGGDVLHIPIALGAVVVAYNEPGIEQLELDGPTLADIFLGTITRWDDPRIASLNQGVSLPSDDIEVVHRSDSSGTSFGFTGYLSAVSPAWRSSAGQDKAPEWPTGIGGEGNDGVAAAVQQTKGAIGYVELAYALENSIPYATLKNASGELVKPSLASTSAAGQDVEYPADLRFQLVDSKAPGAYPIVTATWQLVWKHPARAGLDRAEARAIANWLTWELSTGQTTAPDLQYAPLPKDLQSAAVKLLDTMVLPAQ